MIIFWKIHVVLHKIFGMKNSSVLGKLIVIIAFAMLYSCSSSPESKLVGTWKVEDVSVEFDEQKAGPNTIQQVAEREKKTILKFTSDSTLSIIDNNNTHRTFWVLEDDGLIRYQFEKDQTFYELGKFENKVITATTSTALGDIVTVFKKSN